MSERSWIHDFSDPSPDGSDLKTLLGGKGASLKQMCRAGLNVPPGFTITTAACAAYFDRQRRWPEGLEEEVRENLARLESASGRRFGRGARPLLVSVRSGAAVSMPGMMDTILNCGLHPGLADDVGDTPAFWHLYVQFIESFASTVDGLDRTTLEAEARSGDGQAGDGRAWANAYLQAYARATGRPFPTDPWQCLVACINAVFDSWNNERAVTYRKHHDVRGLAGTAVSVQMMFPSEVSGILFSQDPNDLASGRMIVEASYGLGEAVVSGGVSPDRFSINRDDPADFTVAIGQKAHVIAALGQSSPRDPDAPSLDARQIAELCDLGLRIEEFFGHPVDVEWGWAEGRFALLQARAIRGLDVAREVETARQEEIARLRAMTDGRRRVWVTHNLAETLPLPTPLSWDIVGEFMTGDGGFGQMYRQLGYRPSAAARREGFLDLIGGRVYADPDRLAGMFWDGMPMRYELDALVEDKGLLDRGPTKFDPDQADGRFLVRLPGTLWAMWRSSKIMRRARRDAARRFLDEVLPPYLKYVEEKRAQDLGPLSDEQVLDELDARRVQVLTRFGPESLVPGFVGSLAFDALQQLLVQLMGPDEGTAMAATLTRALEGDTTFEQDALLYRVAHGGATMEEFLDRFGHRASNEMELAEPRWREEPRHIEQLASRMQSLPRGPEEIHEENLARRSEAQQQLPGVLARRGGSSLREPIEENLHEARALLPYRESGKHYLMMGYELLRLVIEELAERWDLGRKIYFLRLDEMRDFARNRDELERAIEARRLRWRACQRLDMPDVIDSHELDGLGLPRPVEAASELKGTPVAAGAATGTVRIVLNPHEAGDLGDDPILVCPSTDPGWTPLFLSIRGLVIERGGVLSHGAIVARDFGIPAVVCPDATRILQEGARVRVDGNHGTVSVLAEEGVAVG